MSGAAPFIVGLGGTMRLGSTSELALRHALSVAEEMGAATEAITGPALELPFYDADNPHRTPAARRLIQCLRAADGVILSSPSYHGSVSGMLKNALDYAEDLRGDDRPYFDGRAVGCIVCAHGIQSMGVSLVAMRTIVHSLRGWPTPFAATLNSSEPPFLEGQPADEETARKLATVAEQVVHFARMTAGFERDEAGRAPVREAAPA